MHSVAYQHHFAALGPEGGKIWAMTFSAHLTVNPGVDVLHVIPRERPDRRFVTTVRDGDCGAVLDVSRGKGVAALKRFERKRLL